MKSHRIQNHQNICVSCGIITALHAPYQPNLSPPDHAHRPILQKPKRGALTHDGFHLFIIFIIHLLRSIKPSLFFPDRIWLRNERVNDTTWPNGSSPHSRPGCYCSGRLIPSLPDAPLLPCDRSQHRRFSPDAVRTRPWAPRRRVHGRR